MIIFIISFVHLLFNRFYTVTYFHKSSYLPFASIYRIPSSIFCKSDLEVINSLSFYLFIYLNQILLFWLNFWSIALLDIIFLPGTLFSSPKEHWLCYLWEKELPINVVFLFLKFSLCLVNLTIWLHFLQLRPFLVRIILGPLDFLPRCFIFAKIMEFFSSYLIVYIFYDILFPFIFWDPQSLNIYWYPESLKSYIHSFFFWQWYFKMI